MIQTQNGAETMYSDLPIGFYIVNDIHAGIIDSGNKVFGSRTLSMLSQVGRLSFVDLGDVILLCELNATESC